MRPKSARGFTLIELAVVLVIGSLLSVGLAAWLADSRASVRQQDRPLIWSGQAQSTLARLSSDCRSAVRVEVHDGNLQLTPDGATELTVYSVEQSEDGPAVLVRKAPGGRTVLATDVTSFDLTRSPGRLDVALHFAATLGDYHPQTIHRATVALPREAP